MEPLAAHKPSIAPLQRRDCVCDGVASSLSLCMVLVVAARSDILVVDWRQPLISATSFHYRDASHRLSPSVAERWSPDDEGVRMPATPRRHLGGFDLVVAALRAQRRRRSASCPGTRRDRRLGNRARRLHSARASANPDAPAGRGRSCSRGPSAAWPRTVRARRARAMVDEASKDRLAHLAVAHPRRRAPPPVCAATSPSLPRSTPGPLKRPGPLT